MAGQVSVSHRLKPSPTSDSEPAMSSTTQRHPRSRHARMETTCDGSSAPGLRQRGQVRHTKRLIETNDSGGREIGRAVPNRRSSKQG
jgi:hypothetical protein